MVIRTSRLIVCMVILVSLTPSGMRAQTVATFVGTVKDSTGGVLPGAAVSARHLGSKEQRHAVTNEQGDYRIALLLSLIHI